MSIGALIKELQKYNPHAKFQIEVEIDGLEVVIRPQQFVHLSVEEKANPVDGAVVSLLLGD